MRIAIEVFVLMRDARQDVVAVSLTAKHKTDGYGFQAGLEIATCWIYRINHS